MRKRLDLDKPVPLDVVRECVEIATQAPTGSNRQGWHFMIVTDAVKRAGLADIYRGRSTLRTMAVLRRRHRHRRCRPRRHQQQRVISSAVYLADVMGRYPST